MQPITLSTEDLNSYGTWLPLSGANLEHFMKNPVMFYDHRTYDKPIGHWENIHMSNGKLVGTPVFDEGDPEAVNVKRKYENGDIKGASLGLDILELSDEPAYLKPGQTRPTVKKYSVFEASLTPLPNNTNCLQLRRGQMQLSGTDNRVAIDAILPPITIKPNPINMEKIALKLGLGKEASEEQICQKIDEMAKAQGRELVLSKFVKEQSAAIAPEAKEVFDGLIDSDPENALKVLKLSRQTEKPAEGPEEKTKVSDMLKATLSATQKEQKQETDKETFDYLQKHDPQKLMSLKRSDPAKFQKLVDEYTSKK
ncbi:MAG: hypothetical protein RBS07_07750 [Lentimicrobium sp.]|jgi:hypothetical protein|nr:hypothetical protein [Lentimicrobium sp.]